MRYECNPYPNVFQASATEPPFRITTLMQFLQTTTTTFHSYLSDFFYVWLERAIGDLYTEPFSTPLTPKSKEIAAYKQQKLGGGKGVL